MERREPILAGPSRINGRGEWIDSGAFGASVDVRGLRPAKLDSVHSRSNRIERTPQMPEAVAVATASASRGEWIRTTGLLLPKQAR